MNEDNQGKLAYLGGVKAVLLAMDAHPKATQAQGNGCLVPRRLAVDEDNRIKLAFLPRHRGVAGCEERASQGEAGAGDGAPAHHHHRDGINHRERHQHPPA